MGNRSKDCGLEGKSSLQVPVGSVEKKREPMQDAGENLDSGYR